MEDPLITSEALVADVLTRWPQTIPVFMKYQTSCVGCSLSAFETLGEAARNYKLPLAQFLNDLRQAIQN